jgi:hypothetical protein
MDGPGQSLDAKEWMAEKSGLIGGFVDWLISYRLFRTRICNTENR